MNSNEFSDIGINVQYCRALDALDFHTPTKIQYRAIPTLLQGRDVLGIAQTGTGKTLAFGLPLLQMLDEGVLRAQPKQPLALVLAPTRELAAQIQTEMRSFSGKSNIRIACIFGGVKQHSQVRNLQKGVDVLVATPGRLLDLMNQGHVSLKKVSHLVLDEADRLLDLGFSKDIKRISSTLPKKRQTLLFSATMPKEVAQLAQDLLYKPERIDVAPKQVTVAKIEQRISFVEKSDKPAALAALLKLPEVRKAIVFTRTKHGADRVTRKLNATNIVAEAIHGNKSQNARTRALANFSKGDAWVLVATDIAARGIDISGITHVINFELPNDPESYVHRIGRTGRAGTTGIAWSLVESAERKHLKGIERLIKLSLKDKEVDLEFSRDKNANHNQSQGGDRPAREREEGQAGRSSRDNSKRRQGSAGNSPGPTARPNKKRKVGNAVKADGASEQGSANNRRRKPRKRKIARPNAA